MPHRILIVDDEPDELAAWEPPLRRQGYVVRSASTAEDALNACDQMLFDLVILDYLMPKMRGLELLARIRKKLPLVRSIVVSGKLDRNVEAKELRDSIRGEVETDKYLHKPVTNEQLLEAVSEVLTETKQSRPWDAIADDILKREKGSIRKAKGAQSKLRKHLRKK